MTRFMLPLVLQALLVPGCLHEAFTGVTWSHPTKGFEERGRDQQVCEQLADQEYAKTNASVNYARYRLDQMKTCMAVKGYTVDQN